MYTELMHVSPLTGLFSDTKLRLRLADVVVLLLPPCHTRKFWCL